MTRALLASLGLHLGLGALVLLMASLSALEDPRPGGRGTTGIAGPVGAASVLGVELLAGAPSPQPRGGAGPPSEAAPAAEEPLLTAAARGGDAAAREMKDSPEATGTRHDETDSEAEPGSAGAGMDAQLGSHAEGAIGAAMGEGPGDEAGTLAGGESGAGTQPGGGTGRGIAGTAVSDDRPPVPLHVSLPVRPRNAQPRDVEGKRVRLLVHVSEKGEVSEVKVLTSSGMTDLDASALEAARRMRYAPGWRSGAVAEMWTETEFSF